MQNTTQSHLSLTEISGEVEAGGWRRHEDDDTCHLRLLAEYEGDVSPPELAGDGHPQDQSDQSLHLLLLPQPGELGEVGHPGGVEEEAQLVSVVASQSPQHPAEVSLHEDPGCERVGPEPARQGKFEENVLQSVSDGLSGGLTEEGSSQVRIIFRIKIGWRGRV